MSDAANWWRLQRRLRDGQVCSAGRCVMTLDEPLPARSTTGVSCRRAAPRRQLQLPNAAACAVRVELPFAFRYWSTNLAAGAMVNVATSGFLNLTGGTDTARTGTIPSTVAPNGLIAPYWRDQRMRGGVCLATLGAAPNRQWVIEWNDAGFAATGDAGVSLDGGAPVAPESHLTYEVILTEGTNTIDFVYQRMEPFLQATVGIENVTGASPGASGCPDPSVFACTPFPSYVVRFEPIP
ncbi:MAG: hypothetical protein U0325_36895 [Polyangiales bacterium]